MSGNQPQAQIVTKESASGEIEQAIRTNAAMAMEVEHKKAGAEAEAHKKNNQADSAHGEVSQAVIEEVIGVGAIKTVSTLLKASQELDPAASGTSGSQITMEQMIKGEGGKAAAKEVKADNLNHAPSSSRSIWSEPAFSLAERERASNGVMEEISGTQASKESVAALTSEVTTLTSSGMLSAQHLGNAIRAKAEHAPTPSGMGAPSLNHNAPERGPAFIDDKAAKRIQEEIDAGKATDWA